MRIVVFICSINWITMWNIIIYVAQWWEKYLSKRSLIKHTRSWHDKLIVLWTLNRQTKVFLRMKMLIKHFFYDFFSIYKKRQLDTVRKIKKGFEKRLVKGIKIFQKKKKPKSENMVVNDIEIFLKKEKIKSANRLMKNIENFQKMKKG